MKSKKFKYLKVFEDFEEGNVTTDQLKDCIKKGGTIKADRVSELNLEDKTDEEKEMILSNLKPVSYDDKTGKVTIEWENNYYEVDSKEIKSLDF